MSDHVPAIVIAEPAQPSDHTHPPSGPIERTVLLSVVVPAYNEGSRLGPSLERLTSFLSQQPFGWELIVADDGSKDNTVALAQEYAADWKQMRVLIADRNQGKGAAVRRGVLAARGSVVLFSDADLSTPIEEIDRLLAFIDAGNDVVIGSRELPTSNIVTPQPVHRRAMGKVFRSITARVAQHGVHDSQCGFKAFRTAAARHIFSQLETESFAFDVEVILLARQLGYQVSEVGVTWADNRDSTVSPIRDPARMLRDVWRLRRGVRDRIMRALPYTSSSKAPGIALVRLSPPAWGGDDIDRSVTSTVAEAVRASDTVLHPPVSGEAIVTLMAVTQDEARTAGRRLAVASTDAAAAVGAGSSMSYSVHMLPMATPIEAVVDEADRLARHIDESPRSLLARLQARTFARNADQDELAVDQRLWSRRRRTVRTAIVINLLGLFWWLLWLLDFRHAGSLPLYSLLVVAEAFSIVQVLGYWYTVWHEHGPEHKTGRVMGEVDVFIPTYNEPLFVVERTLRAAKAMPYPHRLYLLDDGKRSEMEQLARRLGATWITRDGNQGAKAGNINHALSVTSGDFFAVFDADHAPHPDFLDRMMPYLADSDVAFVQSPQYYVNRDVNYVAGGAMDQQEIFFGPICRGKAGVGAVFCCGTNMVMRRASIESVGGMSEDSIVEDAATSVELHEKGWQSRYVPERLAEGLAPEDLSAYLSQQRRWARGNIEILFKGRLLQRRMPLVLRLQYLWSAMYYLTGLSALVYLALPLLFLLFGVQTVSAGASDFIAHFFPYIFVTLFILARSAEGRLRFRAIQLSYGLFPVFLSSLWSVATGRQTGFRVTPKIGSRQSFYHLIIPQMVVIAISVLAIAVGFMHFAGARTVTNASWTAFNIIMLSAMVRAAAPQAAAAGAEAETSSPTGVESAA